jgi:NIMA (never in mitosis gene a)-related kinase
MEQNNILKLKDFEIIKELGCGSYGRVQLVKRKEDKKYYALKSMFLANAKQKEKEAALNEIRLLASIDMPYVISYKSSFYVAENQTLCIVMEYANEGDLEHKINDRTELYSSRGFEESFIWKTAFHLLKGLKGLHDNNIIHRDLKCANIFYVHGVAKIGDLNISKITDNGFATTQTGTPYYTSPEIWKG